MGDESGSVAVTSAAYSAASTLTDALDAMASGARVIAGGTDLVVAARNGKQELPSRLISIHALDELKEFRWTDAGLRLGALTSHATIADDPGIRERMTGLADASAIVGSHATRNTGTIGGNLMNCSPAMETGAPLVCFGATVELRSVAGSRTVAVDELMCGPGTTSARPDELLVGIDVPLPPPETGSCYARLEYRRQMEVAIVGAAAQLTLDRDRIADARVALTAVAPVIFRVPAAEQALLGSEASTDAFQRAAAAAAAAAEPISDVRASDRYRRAMIEVITRRALVAAVGRARGERISVPASDALYGAV